MLNFFRRFLKDARGVASIEFVMVLPLMIVLTFAVFEFGQLIRANMKVQNAATSIADLVSQQAAGVTGGTSGSLGNYCTAGKLTMTPFATNATSGGGTFTAAIASVTNYTTGGVVEDWESDGACTASATPIGSTAAIALATKPLNVVPTAGSPGDSVIIVQVTYTYSSAFAMLFPRLSTITQTAYARPRDNQNITCTAPCS